MLVFNKINTFSGIYSNVYYIARFGSPVG